MKADLILHNGKFYTMEAAQPWVEAAACANGRILAVGRSDDVLALAGPQTEVIDVNGRFGMPGFTDAHVHFLQYAMRRQQVSLFGVADFAEVRRRIETAVSQAEPGQWVVGWGWDDNLWGFFPTAAMIDDISPHTPVVLARMDMHTWWANSAAMQAANITAATPDPIEAKIDRDANGQPVGLFREWNAIKLLEDVLPQPDPQTLAEWMADTIAEAHRFGITAIHDQRVENEGALSFQVMQALHRQGRLALRVHKHIAADHLQEALTLGLAPGFGDDFLWLGHMKAFADGAMGSRTALMLSPYEGEPDNVGVLVTPPNELWETAVAAAQAGFPMSVHAIGDRAVRQVLDVFQEHVAGAGGQQITMPHRIEHVQVIHPDDVGKLAHPQIVASVQPVHILTDWPVADRVWGDRARLAYAFRTLLAHGARFAFGSDAPVAPFNPMLGVYAAVMRQDARGNPAGGWYPEQRLTMAETLAAYTLGPAQLAGKAAVQGSLAPGKWADVVVLDRDLFAVSGAEILETAVCLTVFNGRVVWRGC